MNMDKIHISYGKQAKYESGHNLMLYQNYTEINELGQNPLFNWQIRQYALGHNPTFNCNNARQTDVMS